MDRNSQFIFKMKIQADMLVLLRGEMIKCLVQESRTLNQRSVDVNVKCLADRIKFTNFARLQENEGSSCWSLSRQTERFL